jgi:fumarate reductase flavoprotein subunit
LEVVKMTGPSKTDIAIIGGGTAGLAAAVTAAERGASVAIFEKAATTGGTGLEAVAIIRKNKAAA